jgi:TonB family protein
MARLAALPLAALALVAVVSAQGVQRAEFIPPRLTAASLPPLPSPNVAGGGEVLIEAIVDRRGAMTRPSILRATPPYTQFVLDAISRWRFEPARDIDYKGFDTTVEMPVTVVAFYRPPVLMNTPTIGEPPRDLMKPSGDVAYPTATAMPNYPPLARDGGVVLFEVVLNEGGAVTEIRSLGSAAGFESAAREALASWRFKGAMYRARPVPANAYVLFGFRPPVGLSAPKPAAGLLPPTFGILSFR